jgi:hypothetical protein
MKRSTSEASQLMSHMTYKLDGITYLPHYRNCNVFIGPGYPRANRKRYTSTELINSGAVAVEQMLWSRGEHGVINDVNV